MVIRKIVTVFPEHLDLLISDEDVITKLYLAGKMSCDYCSSVSLVMPLRINHQAVTS